MADEAERSNRARLWLDWAAETFGGVALDRRERTLRFLEEALELSQALGVEEPVVNVLLARVYGRFPGDVSREFGQTLACFETLAHVAGVDADVEAWAELDRVRAIPREEWARRYGAKRALGIAG